MATHTSVTSGPPRAQGVRAGVGAPVRSSSPSPVGLWYGSQSSPKFLPTAAQLINLYQDKKIEKMWICCDTPPDGRGILQYITANEETNIEVYLYIPTPVVREIAQPNLSPDAKAEAWIQLITDYQTNISYVCLGNVGQMNDTDIHIFEAAKDRIIRSLQSSIKVSTIIDVNIIFGSYDPTKCPSGYRIHETFHDVLFHVVALLVESSTPLFVKTFPNCAINDNINQGNIALDNYLLEERAKPYMYCDQWKYKYVFDAMVDSISCAIDVMGFSNVNISVVSGWPTAESTEATIQNAQRYNSNLLRYVTANEATPRNTKIKDCFIFSVVNEDLLETNDGIDWKYFGTFTIWKNETFPQMDGSAEAA